ncbi:alpha/beta fold hydrolase [Nocardiopsis metallicus]|uniref:Pimeloyl-ACP methyl ester carboxylesterase n=1 Tax=Nocardiopsis metallicus TaxID=179819 RepID=A0A840W1Q1_9ACTN|nr:alpha/beta fold hydrolase [Nocardiopsis metallicus]MBB5490729.1 pimeloyl-ACP methyl ester carboxylesterase [Nocardiopsis metallicus]
MDYDRRGDGPPLLLVPGGVGHGGMLDPLAAHLADRFDVVTMSSRVASAKQPETLGDQRPGDHAEDVLGLIDHLFAEPPIVFGFSSGAVTALELLAQRPDRVRLAVVHEPPLVNLLPDAARHRAALESVRAAARDRGLEEAQELMTTAVTAPGPDPGRESDLPRLQRVGAWSDGYAGTGPEPLGPELAELFVRLGELQGIMLEHIMLPFTTHEPGLSVLAAHSDQLVPVVGVDSAGQLPYRTAAALAARLGLPLTEFPGGHLGPVERPAQFAGALKDLLGTR